MDNDQLDDDFFDTEDIYIALESANLVDTHGVPVSEDPEFLYRHKNFLTAQAKKNCDSSLSGDTVPNYFLNIDIWPEETVEASVSHVKTEYEHVEEALVAIAGQRWSVVLTRGAKDGEIPRDIAQQLLVALEVGQLVWSRSIPEPEWFRSNYSTASEIIGTLRERIPEIRVVDPSQSFGFVSPDAYITECVGLDTFGAFEFDLPDDSYPDMYLTGHILIDAHWKEDLPDILEHYLPQEWEKVYIAGDGWIIRLLSDFYESSTGENLSGYAHTFSNILGGRVSIH